MLCPAYPDPRPAHGRWRSGSIDVEGLPAAEPIAAPPFPLVAPVLVAACSAGARRSSRIGLRDFIRLLESPRSGRGAVSIGALTKSCDRLIKAVSGAAQVGIVRRDIAPQFPRS